MNPFQSGGKRNQILERTEVFWAVKEPSEWENMVEVSVVYAQNSEEFGQSTV